MNPNPSKSYDQGFLKRPCSAEYWRGDMKKCLQLAAEAGCSVIKPYAQASPGQRKRAKTSLSSTDKASAADSMPQWLRAALARRVPLFLIKWFLFINIIGVRSIYALSNLTLVTQQ
jgi:hypothetical protein